MTTPKVISFSGAHGTGKTVAALKLAAQLREMGKNVGILPSSSRDSLYLETNDLSKLMHMEVITSQITNEVRACKIYDLVVTDRNVVDFYSYGVIRFGEADPFMRTLKQIVEAYFPLYRNVVFMEHPYVDVPLDVMQSELTQTIKKYYQRHSSQTNIQFTYSESEIFSKLAL